MLEPAGGRLRNAEVETKIERGAVSVQNLVGDDRAVVEHEGCSASIRYRAVGARNDDILGWREPTRPRPTALVAMMLEHADMRAAGQVIP